MINCCAMTYLSIIVALLLSCSFLDCSPTSSCRDLILKTYPNAKCVDGGENLNCLKECEHYGALECQGKRGKIHRLNCKKSPSTCCCNISCEDNNSTLARLEKALTESKIIQNSYKCVSAMKSEIKEELKNACRKDFRVQVARKYCLEEHQGKYYCLKDGKCFGNLCKGCVKHECEINGTKMILNPPESYAQKLQASGFHYEPAIAQIINVEDKPNLRHERKWCTFVDNLQEKTFEMECLSMCREFGQKMCNSIPEKLEPTNECIGNEQKCQCCCQPSCDLTRMPICETKPVTEPAPAEEDCEKDGMALGYPDSYEDRDYSTGNVGVSVDGVEVQVSSSEEYEETLEGEDDLAS